MLKNYLKIAWRNLFRQATYTVLNLTCLSLGVAASLIILLYLDFELNFDQFHQKSDRIYRIETMAIQTHEKEIAVDWERTSAPLGPYLQQDFPEVESFVRFYQFFRNESIELQTESETVELEALMVADESLLDIFSFQFIHGDPTTALNAPNKLILSTSTARQIFGKIDVVGTIIRTELNHISPNINPDYELVVSGVYEDFPNNSHIPAEAFLSAKTDPRLAEYEIGHFNFYTYVLLNPNVEADALAKKTASIYTKYIDPEQEPVMKWAVHQLVPLRDIHLAETGGYTYIYSFSIIGLLILFIAIISYVNLVTAKGSKRALEIGIRKVMGSTRAQLIRQFLAESLTISSIAIVLGLLMVRLALSPLNGLLDLELSARQLLQPNILLGIVAIFFIVGILGGSYPAFFLSNFAPSTVLKKERTKGWSLSNVLIAVQFAIVFIVLASTGIVYQQLQYLSDKSLGFNRNQIIQLTLNDAAQRQKTGALKTAFRQNPMVKQVGTASFLPGMGMGRRPLSADNGESRASQFVYFGDIDYDFLETMDIPLVAGRNFSTDFPADTIDHLIVNEALVKSFGLENPIGEKVRYGDKNNPNFKRIIGVVSDFHQNSLHNPIGPQMFLLARNNPSITVKVDRVDSKSMTQLEETWRTVFPNTPFDYQFLDGLLAANYEIEEIRQRIFLLFSVLTVLITFIGLFGLVAYTTQQRTKEIGIRRVLGASSWHVISLIATKFLGLVGISAIPAFFIAWYFADTWLQDFAFHTSVSPLLFIGILLSIGIFTFLITALHALRIAELNPANTLKM
ncbi:MAG: FtsX-like permease family protein [Bacteroidota bacterium]